jgi:hypothetical protein
MKIIKLSFRNDMDVTANAIAKIVSTYVRRKHKYGFFKMPNESYDYSLDLNPKKQEKRKDFSPREQHKRINEGVIKLDPVVCDGGIMQVKLLINVTKSSGHGPHFSSKPEFRHRPTNPPIDPEIFIQTLISTDFSEQDYDDYYIDLVNAVRHELAHTDQFIQKRLENPNYNLDELRNPSSPKSKLDQNIKYLSQKMEEEAFIRGFMLESKKKGTDLRPALIKYIDSQLGFDDDKYIKELVMFLRSRVDVIYEMMNSVRNKLINSYIARAEHIYPNLANFIEKKS